MVIEYARDVAGLEKANSTEFDPETPEAVIATMATQVDVVPGERDMGGTMRLGSYPATLQHGSVTAGVYGVDRGHRAAPAPLRGGQRLPRPARPRPGWSSPGPRPTARWSSSPSCPARCTRSSSAPRRTRSCKSRPTRPHPLFAGFVQAAIDYQESARLPVVVDEAQQVGI